MPTRVPPVGVLAGMTSFDIASLAGDLLAEWRIANGKMETLAARMKTAGVFDRDTHAEARAICIGAGVIES